MATVSSASVQRWASVTGRQAPHQTEVIARGGRVSLLVRESTTPDSR